MRTGSACIITLVTILMIVAAFCILSFCCLGGLSYLDTARSFPTPSQEDEVAQLETALRREFADYPYSYVRSVEISGGELIIYAHLGPTGSEDRLISIGLIHLTVVRHKPDVQYVIIKDTGGQRIAVSMADLLDCYYGRIEANDCMLTWQITKD